MASFSKGESNVGSYLDQNIIISPIFDHKSINFTLIKELRAKIGHMTISKVKVGVRVKVTWVT